MSGFSMDAQNLLIWANTVIVLGTIFLIGKGAHWLVDSASRLAARLGISELVVGLTVERRTAGGATLTRPSA